MQLAPPKKHKTISYAKYGYLFILPFFITYAFFMIYPLINTIVLSFKGNGSTSNDWVGFQNYVHIFAGDSTSKYSAGATVHEEFWRDFGNTIILWFGNFFVQIILSLLLAVWFSDNVVKIKGEGFFKVVVYMPNIITAASVASLFLLLFGNSKYGAVNSMLLNMGAIKDVIPFINQPGSSRILVMLIQSWMWFGNTMLLLLSGIYGIDVSIYEAASIDGSSGLNTFFRITMPILKPIFIYVFITSMIGGLQMFDIPFLLHEGNSASSYLETVAVFIYKYFHQANPNYGYSAAASVILFIITCALGIIVYKFNTDPTQTFKVKKKKRSKISF